MEENIKKLLKERTELEAKFAKMKKDLADNLKYIDEDFESYRSKDLLTKDEQLARFEQIKKEYTTKAEADMNAVKAEIDKINENITSKIITLRGEWAKKLNHEIDLAEKQEQLALAKYIESGKIEVHLRKARRIYLEKSKVILDSIKKQFGCSAKVVFNETSLYISIFISGNVNRKAVDEKLRKLSVGIMPYKTENNEFGLSFSGIPQDKIASGIKILSETVLTHT